MPEFRAPPIVSYHQPHHGHFNYTDYHLNMLSVSQENFEKTAAYSAAQLPLKHLVSRVLGREKNSKETCILPPSYPWTNSMSSDEFDKNLILSGLTTTKNNRKVKGSLTSLSTSLKSAFSPTENERAMLEKRALPATADEAFQKNQLAPLTFLTNPLWSNLVPSNFIARAWSCCLNLPCEAYFFVEPKKEKGLFSSRHYVATVTGPSNYVCPFEMRVEADEFGKEIRYAYSFQPCEAGVYTVKIRLAASGTPDVHGSPLKIHVCQKPDNSLQQYSRPTPTVSRQQQGQGGSVQASNNNDGQHNRLNNNNSNNRNRNWIPPPPQQSVNNNNTTTINNNESNCRAAVTANCCMYSSGGVHHHNHHHHQHNNNSRPCPSSSSSSSSSTCSGNSGMMMNMVTHG